ncbi:Hpt domain-containing protein [Aureimonas sp. ME7]|uniref:Hpt domain-containing protein n=1 Tax=Aureimonas sp. ME7 TaxID=2744252 RepID=UPI002453A32B|nr:Hpt domain-containing protein [Aureimonas sp. ME7]
MVEIRATFFEECAEGLEALDGTLPAFAGGTPDAETIGVAYRAVHSIKGGAASFKLAELTGFAKTFESLLGEIRSGNLATDAAVADLIARSAKTLRGQVALSRETCEIGDEIRAYVPAEEPAPVEEATGLSDFERLGFQPVAFDLSTLVGDGGGRFDIVFRPHASLYASANEASRLIRQVLALGEGRVVAITDDVPSLEAMEPEGAALAFRIELETAEGEEAIREIFEFVEDDCELEITRLESPDEHTIDGESPEDVFAALLAAATR